MQAHNIRLIDNAYDLEIAKELLERFISQKIAFIEDRIMDTDPNDDVGRNQLTLRISDLKAERRSLDLLIEEHDGEHVAMHIGCTVVMSIKKIERNQSGL
jgi:hypothetical protein